MIVEKPQVARQITYSYLHSFSVHMLLSNMKISASTAVLIFAENSGKVVPNGGIHTASMYPPKEKTKGSKVRRTRWPSDRTAHASWYLEI
jgi:hypothetical protein